MATIVFWLAVGGTRTGEIDIIAQALTVVVFVHEGKGAVHEVAEGLAQVGIVREHQAHLTESQITSKDGIMADVPPERVHRIPERMRETKSKKTTGGVGSGQLEP